MTRSISAYISTAVFLIISSCFACAKMKSAQTVSSNGTVSIMTTGSQEKSWWINTGLSFYSLPPQSNRFAWCPDVKCKSPQQRESIEPDLCQQKWVFILSTGRSGSTSILETLNAISWPRSDVNVRLRGEHDGAMTDMVNYVERVFSGENSSNTFVFKPGQSYNLHQKLILYQIQRLFSDVNPPEPELRNRSSSENAGTENPMLIDRNRTILGFKEIRYNDDRHIHFLKAAFPCSRIIFNYRLDVLAQRKSGFYKKYITVEELQAKNQGRSSNCAVVSFLSRC